MRALIISDGIVQRIREVVAHASQRDHWYDPTNRTDGWLDRLPGNNPEHCVTIPDNYRCVFSYSISGNKQVWRHLSVSVPAKGAMPSPEAIITIAPLFGFTGKVNLQKALDRTPDMFPDSWMVHVQSGNVIDDDCIVLAERVLVGNLQLSA